ncbi:MAG: methyltransferase domain-containing protein [Candidatus Pedobacter colombiensis]|uniref:Methyltransferase domain-containing protein n=1 Tax=Candidatus Pedobacter colombiensis TaxID=3121371 RepID=A0AAJ5WA47_9SPHI|nr:methyltransferase domain-containing protein [Pedobacter sp.]WEK20842.1 MAG: methyltransferase domain-containing protein [Pedobacter sp.]
MLVDTSRRSDDPELMDDFLLEGEVLRKALDKIASINRLLGGNKVTLQGVEWLLKSKSSDTVEITILDVGCGNGDMLRALSNYARKKKLNLKLVGMDANYFTIKHAEQLSANYPDISYVCANIFEEIKQERLYDVILCTLTLHHFKDDEIKTLMSGLKEQSALGIVVNDLHRNVLAYYLFTALCFVFRLNHMSRNDGLVSILRGFKRQELHDFSKQLSFNNYVLKWKWAFRYQWIIRTI